MFKVQEILLVVCTIAGQNPITFGFSTINAVFGSQVTLNCNVALNETVDEVIWKRSTTNGNITFTPDIIGIFGSTPENPSLIIRVASTLDSGLYTCSIRTHNETVFGNSTKLRIKGGSPNVKIEYTSQSGVYGIPITLYVDIDANPLVYHIFWTKESKNEEIITINSRATGYEGGNMTVPSLTISYPRFGDNGLYKCYARNDFGIGYSDTISVNVEGDVPKVSIDASTHTIVFGGTISLNCYVTAFPNYTRIFWKKARHDSITTITEDTAGVIGSTIDVPMLTIKFATISDGGSYTCLAENVVGIGSSRSTLLTVTGGRPIIKTGSAIYSSIYGSSVTLSCDVTGEPPSTVVYWQKKGDGAFWSVITSGTVGTQGINVTQPSITIMFPVKSDSGEYVCFAVNPLGSSSSQPTLLTIIGDIPSVSVISNATSAMYGSHHTLYCTVESTPVHTEVYWEFIKNGAVRKISSQTSGIQGANRGNPSLTINFVTISDDGLYTCHAVNIVGTGRSQTIRLYVDAIIPIVTVDLLSYTIKEGTGISLSCDVVSKPKHTNVYWHKEKDGVTSTVKEGTTGIRGVTIDKPSLIFDNLGRKDSGLYVCFATNVIGTGSSRGIVLEVEPFNEDTEKTITVIQQSSINAATLATSISSSVGVLVLIIATVIGYCEFNDKRKKARKKKETEQTGDEQKEKIKENGKHEKVMELQMVNQQLNDSTTDDGC